MASTSFIYLLHFSTPVGHARHYLGSAADVEARLSEHRAGQGARLTQVAIQRGASLLLARVWVGGRCVGHPCSAFALCCSEQV